MANVKAKMPNRVSLPFVTAKTVRATKSMHGMVWKDQKGNGLDFVDITSSGHIRMLKTGWIDVRVSVNHKNDHDNVLGKCSRTRVSSSGATAMLKDTWRHRFSRAR